MVSSQASDNLKKALNAVRCMVNALGNNTWTLVAAAFYAARSFGYDDMLVTYLNMGAELICTCAGDEVGLTMMLVEWNMYPSPQDMAEFFGACSENAMALIETNEDDAEAEDGETADDGASNDDGAQESTD